jgi:hypothetical protein
MLRICGTAIITNAIGRSFAMFTIESFPEQLDASA